MKNKILAIAASLMLVFSIAACNQADTVSHNIGQEADQFHVLRRIVFMNGITDKYLLTIEGFCSLGNDRTSTELNVTCATGPGQFKKHFLGLSDNVTYFVEQLESSGVDTYRYKVIFRPLTLIPDVEVQ